MKDNSRNYIVYEHISPSGKVYVGQTYNLKIRWQANGRMYLNKTKKGKYAQPYFAHALLKYGWDAFEHRIILEGVSKNEANYAEKYLIKWYKLHKMSYNMTDGGEGTCGIKRTMSPEMREYMSKYMRANSVLIGTHRTEKQKQAVREKMLGRKMSAEARAKMSKSHTGEKQYWKNKKIYAFDKTTKEFVKSYDSISEAAGELGLFVSAITSSAKGRCPSAGPYIWSYTSTIDADNPLYSRMFHNKIYCYDFEGKFVAEYNSTKEAADVVNGSVNCIRNCCLGISLTHKGFIWRDNKEEIDKEIIEKLSKRKVA
jgi:group I intron endonuclease